MDKAIQLTEQYFMPEAVRYPIVLSHGKGCFLYDTSGKEYLDLLGGIAVNALGYAHPALLKALSEQAAKLIHCSNYFYTEKQAQLLQKICGLAGLDRAFICNSGAEANEGAIKLARKYGTGLHPRKYKIISAVYSFHGRTLSTLAATGQPKYHEGYSPLPEGFLHVPFGSIPALEELMDDSVCAVMLEPIQGESGVHPAPKGYLEKVRSLCDACGALLILDEIQTGLCRTGKWFAFQHEKAEPDILTLAKALGGGYPIGAVIASQKAAAAFTAGSHGSTFGGNPLGCAAALAVLGVMETENLCEAAEILGKKLKKGLLHLQNKHPHLLKDVRGCGLLLGVDLSVDGKEFARLCLEKGLILNCTGGGTLRLAPPLIIKSTEIEYALYIFDEVLKNF